MTWVGPAVHLGRPLDGVDSALPGPGPPVTPERGHWGGGQLRCDAFPTVCSPSSPHMRSGSLERPWVWFELHELRDLHDLVPAWVR